MHTFIDRIEGLSVLKDGENEGRARERKKDGEVRGKDRGKEGEGNLQTNSSPTNTHTCTRTMMNDHYADN
jgi:hypothetical protein